MLNLYKTDGTPLMSFETYGDLCGHITRIENEKLLEDHPEFGRSFWSFVIVTPIQMEQRNATAQCRDKGVLVFEEALKNGISVLEWCEGDYNDLVQTPLTPDIDLEDLREDWCLSYCRFHGIEVRDDEGQA